MAAHLEFIFLVSMVVFKEERTVYGCYQTCIDFGVG